MFEIFSHFNKDKLGVMSDIETIIPGLDCSFLLQIILGLSIQLGQRNLKLEISQLNDGNNLKRNIL